MLKHYCSSKIQFGTNEQKSNEILAQILLQRTEHRDNLYCIHLYDQRFATNIKGFLHFIFSRCYKTSSPCATRGKY